jgi:TldD protein
VRQPIVGLVLGFGLLTSGLCRAQSSPLLDTLSQELSRNYQTLKTQGENAPYYMSYSVTENEEFGVGARFGAIFNERTGKARYFDLSLRLGNPTMDNYRLVEGNSARFTVGTRLPVEDVPNAIRPVVWAETDRVFRLAQQRLSALKGRKELKVKETEPADDFSVEKPNVKVATVPTMNYSADEWKNRLRRVSLVFNTYNGVLSSSVGLSFLRQTKSMVDTDGARLQHGRTFARVMIMATAKALDGMNVSANESFEAETPEKLPSEKDLQAAAKRVAEQTVKLANAPLVSPFVGPAILSGSASGVFFHEIFGHRIEGHRQKDVTDGQTFAQSVGKPILPEFLSVISDPTKNKIGDDNLYGSYLFDDEGVAAQPVTLVEKGILKTFLMSRSPLSTIKNSNGHGRRQAGLEPVSRQANLIVESTKGVSDDELKKLLIAEVKRQGKPFGLFFQQVTGGFTTTQRAGLAAFKVLPLVVYRIYADGRPDELVRGVDIVGTPLASFAKILATSNKPGIFNGYCGAESGSIPVSAVAPSILVSELEIQRREFSLDRPPILPSPLSGGER